MSKTPADKSLPPPLRALGGWQDADWFDPSILTQQDIVGFTLPALPGSRKQNFELAERTAPQPAAKKRPAPKAAATPARIPSGISEILDDIGAMGAAAFRRPRFFFEAAPTLFFADIPSANLKARSADALRRNLIHNALRGCVLTVGPKSVAAMFWPSQDIELTLFVRSAAPPHPLHLQFDQAEEERRTTPSSRRSSPPEAAPTKGRTSPPQRDLEERAARERLLAELDGLRSKVVELERSLSVAGAMKTLGLDDERLRAMLLLLHPDRHANSEAANAAAKWVNGLRDVLKESRKA